MPSEGPREEPSWLFLISSGCQRSRQFLDLYLHPSNLYCRHHVASLQGHQSLDAGPAPSHHKLLKLPKYSCKHLISRCQVLGRQEWGGRARGTPINPVQHLTQVPLGRVPIWNFIKGKWSVRGRRGAGEALLGAKLRRGETEKCQS